MELTKEGFKLTLGTDGSKTLLFDTDRTVESCDYFIRTGLKRISIYPGIYKANDLKPLISLENHLEGILLDGKIDYSYLDKFKQLRFLSIQDNRKDIVDLNNFTQLETLCANISNRLIGLETCQNLKVLFANNYKSQTNDLLALPRIGTLEYLGLFQSTITDLRGIDNFMNLNRIHLYGLSKLLSIKELKKVSQNLLDLEFDKCKKITDYETLADLVNLHKIIISKSGQMKSLQFVKSLKKLKFISFWDTNVLDGNINYCKGIDYVGFDNKRHYNCKVEEFKK
jgi:hypothetical protein